MNRPDELAAAPAGAREVVTPSWRLTVPAHVTAESPLIAVPTIHPRGDRRVIRCAQDALNAGFRVRFIWLGADDQPATDPAASEVILPKARSLRQRLGVIPKLAKIAAAEPADLWHIHDLYLLPSAKRWHRRTGRNVLYDVHEYYGLVYAERLGIGGAPGRWLNRAVNRYQVRAARR
ncbi:MAG: glycosyltransferase, partial [Bifidobacteriaceae bacterium]|nr:glycosyltransferase [Bifidobacteriaceae bacterium]